MYDKIKNGFSYLFIILMVILLVWNVYTITFHGYVTNGFWETYYEEEPGVFIADLIELTLEMFLPLIIILGFYVMGFINDWLRVEAPIVSAATKAKRLRRKKRKKKRKQ